MSLQFLILGIGCFYKGFLFFVFVFFVLFCFVFFFLMNRIDGRRSSACFYYPLDKFNSRILSFSPFEWIGYWFNIYFYPFQAVWMIHASIITTSGSCRTQAMPLHSRLMACPKAAHLTHALVTLALYHSFVSTCGGNMSAGMLISQTNTQSLLTWELLLCITV